MNEWSVYVLVPGAGPYDESTADDLLEALAGYHPSLGLGGTQLGVTLTVEAPTPPRALQEALQTVKRAVPSVRVDQLLVAEVQPMASAGEKLPARLSMGEIAELLGVSKQRVSQLRAEHPEFPKPSEDLAAGPVWRRAAVMHFARSLNRRSGRPRKVAET